MNFPTKLRKLRKTYGYTQEQAAEGCGVSIRTYKGYELNERLPRYHKIYMDIACFYGVDLDYLLTDTEELVFRAKKMFGEQSKENAEIIIQHVRGLFAGGALSEQDMDHVFFALTEAYLDARKAQRQRKEDASSAPVRPVEKL